MREELRRSRVVAGPADLRDRLLLVLDEMASNALRHGGGSVEARVRRTGEAFLVAVSDGDTGTPPTPAVDRDPSEGGLGLHLIVELSTAHGWYVDGDAKTVWAVLPPR
jgi:two-component sensor histidine kinase